MLSITYRKPDSEAIEFFKEKYLENFEADSWPGDLQEFWSVQDNGTYAGFAALEYCPEIHVAIFTAACIPYEYRRLGLQKKLIDARLRWARKMGCKFAVTYVAVDNYPSLKNLLDRGFVARWLPKKKWHLLYKPLTGESMTDELWNEIKEKVFG